MKLTSKGILEKSRIEGIFKNGVGSMSIASFCGKSIEHLGWHFCISAHCQLSDVAGSFERNHTQDL